MLFWSSTSGDSNDAIRYADAANNVADSGKWLLTNYQLYKDDLIDGWAPRWLTEQPPLFPISASLLVKSGMDAITVVRCLSAIAFVALPLVVWPIAVRLLRRPVAIGALLMMCVQVSIFSNAMHGLSESTAVLCIYGTLALLVGISAIDDPRKPWRRHIIAVAILTGVSTWIRYGCVFLIPVIVAWGYWVFPRETRRQKLLLYSSLAIILTLPVFLLREFLEVPYGISNVGPLWGIIPSMRYVANLPELLTRPARDLILGGSGYIIPDVVLIVTLIAAGILAWPIIKNGRMNPVFLLLALWISVYLFSFWIVVSTQIPEHVRSRFLLPVYPGVILVFSYVLSHVRWRATILTSLLSISIIFNVRSTFQVTRVWNHDPLPAELLAWLSDEVPQTDLILSPTPRLGYWSNRATLYLPTLPYHQRWFTDEDAGACSRSSRRVWLVIPRRDFEPVRQGVWGTYVAGFLDGTTTSYSQRVTTVDGVAFLLHVES